MVNGKEKMVRGGAKIIVTGEGEFVYFNIYVREMKARFPKG